ncbi:MAG: PilZ domain-containing protein [Candidatus Omnitrophica bacterium]|nr:PilZ domain-containing protein [Candidatus Omnitrophota bacterium]
MNKENERRKDKRVIIEKVDADYKLVDFNFWAESRSKGTNLLKDISAGGMSFSTSETLPKDSLMSLNITLGDMVKVNDVYGRVVRIRDIGNNHHEIGINFSWWDNDADKKNLVKILENQSDPQNPA